MTTSTLTRIAPPKTESRASDDRRKEEADRAFEEGVRWFLAVSRRAVGQAA